MPTSYSAYTLYQWESGKINEAGFISGLQSGFYLFIYISLAYNTNRRHRTATDLSLHLPMTAKPLHENHAREMLNRTRAWMNCLNVERSTASQYGKPPIIDPKDYILNHSDDWWRSSPYNMKHFDIHLCVYSGELKVIAGFLAKIYSNPNHPTGLNKVCLVLLITVMLEIHKFHNRKSTLKKLQRRRTMNWKHTRRNGLPFWKRLIWRIHKIVSEQVFCAWLTAMPDLLHCHTDSNMPSERTPKPTRIHFWCESVRYKQSFLMKFLSRLVLVLGSGVRCRPCCGWWYLSSKSTLVTPLNLPPFANHEIP